MDAPVIVVALSLSLHVTLVASVVVTVWRAARSERVRSTRGCSETRPTVSILKPIAGADDELDANLDAFARLDYPRYEVLLGAAMGDDAAAATARRFFARWPTVSGRFVVTDPEVARNPKVAQLIALARESTGDVLVVSDANVRVEPAYLHVLVDELSRPGVGLVTNLVVGTGERNIGAALENLQLTAAIAPVVVLSTRGGRPLAIGKSMAMRRDVVARIGGFDRVADVLAEDHALARLVEGVGLSARVCLHPVENRNVEGSLRATFERHARWMVMRRTIQPVPFFFEPLTVPWNVALGAVLLGSSPRSWTMLGVAAVVQVVCSLLLVRVLRGRRLPHRYVLVELMRPPVMFASWIRACASRRVTWRGRSLVVGDGSRIHPSSISS